MESINFKTGFVDASTKEKEKKQKWIIVKAQGDGLIFVDIKKAIWPVILSRSYYSAHELLDSCVRGL